MKHFFTRLSFCCIVAFSALTACQKVSSLSDSANIEQISISATEPSKVVFGAPVIKGTTIELPIVYGKYLFPLTVTFDVKTEKGCSQLLGFDKGTSYTFDNLNHIRNLYTVAASGATTLWKLQIVDAMSSESAEVVQAMTTPTQGQAVLIAPIARISAHQATVTFQSAGSATYPMTITPEITLAEGARFIDAEFPKTMTFEDADDTKEFTVEAASGRTKKWKFTTASVKTSDNNESNLSSDQIQRLSIDPTKITITSDKAQLIQGSADFSESNKGGVVNLILKPKGAESLAFPLKATIDIPTETGTLLFGAPEANQYEFSSYSEQKQVWVADKSSGLIKCWRIAISPEMNTGIKSYTITSYTSKVASLTVDKENVVIDNESSRIIVPVNNGLGTPIDAKESLTLKLSITLGLYEGSTCSSTSTSHTYITNTGSLAVKTSNGLQSRTWTVYLKDVNAAASSDTNISNMSLVEYSSKENRMKLYSSSFVADNTTKTITLKITGGVDAFPLVVSKKIFKLSSGAAKILEQDIAKFDTPLTFESLASTKEFTVQAEDGTTAKWTINLLSTATGKTTDITDFMLTDISNGAFPTDIQINAAQRQVKIIIDGVTPFQFKPIITTSDKATVSGMENNTLIFMSFSQQITLKVTSEDCTNSAEWTVSIEKPAKVQIGNSDFEQWGKFKDVNGGTFTIDPTPGAGYGWGTANLEMLGIGVLGTMPGDRTDGSKYAEMTTKDQNTILYGYIVAAGTLYTGIFNLNLGYITQPRKMTKFGIPFTSRPVSFDLEIKYAPGPQLQEATADSKGKYSIHDIEGVDKGHIWVELLHWSGPGAIDYDGSASAPNITVIGRTELVIDGANNPYKEWTKVNLPMVYIDAQSSTQPTHIAVVMSSSKDGDKFIGATDSKLSADNFVINY